MTRLAHQPRTRQLRNAADLQKSAEGMLQLLFSDYSQVKVPSPATASRARRKVDLAMMAHRRLQLQDIGVHNLSFQLSVLV